MYQQRPQIQWSMTTCPCEIAQSPHLSTECSPHVQWTVSFVHLRLKSQSGERSAPKVMSATMAWKSTITWKRIVCKLKSLFRSKIFISLVMALVQIMNLYVLDVWDVCGALVSIYTERGSMKSFEVRLFLKIRLFLKVRKWMWDYSCNYGAPDLIGTFSYWSFYFYSQKDVVVFCNIFFSQQKNTFSQGLKFFMHIISHQPFLAAQKFEFVFFGCGYCWELHFSVHIWLGTGAVLILVDKRGTALDWQATNLTDAVEQFWVQTWKFNHVNILNFK